MICNPCREAGKANQGNYFMLAAELHGQCAYPLTCTCQHRTGREYKK